MDSRCPLKLTEFPIEPCELGKNLFEQISKPFCRCRNPEFINDELLDCKLCGKTVVRCSWGINSIDHNYCFWKYIDSMKKETSDNDISNLLGLTVQRIGQIKKKSFVFLKQFIKKEY